MAAVPDKVLRWLWDTVTTKYHDPNRAYSDVARVLHLYTSVRPRTEVHTSPTGSPALLLLLYGTIPVDFRGAAFNIPLAIWIPIAYPREAPMIYITPTSEMAVRPGQHVSMEGMVYHPYLANWVNHYDRSNIVDFLSILIQLFAKEPPVVASGQLGVPQPRQNPAGPSRPPSVPSQPQEWRRSTSSLQNGAAGPRTDSLVPPKPPKLGRTDEGLAARYSAPAPPPRSDGNQSREQGGVRPDQHARPRPNVSSSINGPPLPPLPGSPVRMRDDGQRQDPVYQRHAQFNNHILTPRQHYPEHPQLYNPRMSQYAPQSPGYSGHSNTQYPQQPHQPQPVQATPKKPIQDLLSSPSDVILPSQANKNTPLPVPQVPPNPERDALLHALSVALCNQLSTTVSQNQSALSALQAQQLALRQAEHNMRSELSELQQLDATLSSNEKILHEALREADVVKESVGQRKAPTVDEVLVAPTVVGEQLYGLVADERGIADAMFVLSRALDKGRIEGDVFVKQTRSLAREQFMRKALIKKIAKGMGLVTEV